MGEWRKLHNEELHDKDYSLNIFGTVKLRTKCGTNRRGKSFMQGSGGIREGKGLLGRPMCRQVDDIKPSKAEAQTALFKATVRTAL